jgi:hypothetical protein
VQADDSGTLDSGVSDAAVEASEPSVKRTTPGDELGSLSVALRKSDIATEPVYRKLDRSQASCRSKHAAQANELGARRCGTAVRE